MACFEMIAKYRRHKHILMVFRAYDSTLFTVFMYSFIHNAQALWLHQSLYYTVIELMNKSNYELFLRCAVLISSSKLCTGSYCESKTCELWRCCSVIISNGRETDVPTRVIALSHGIKTSAVGSFVWICHKPERQMDRQTKFRHPRPR